MLRRASLHVFVRTFLRAKIGGARLLSCVRLESAVFFDFVLRLEHEKNERNYFQLERDKINTFWEISKKELEDRKAELRNKDREMEELEERHQVSDRDPPRPVPAPAAMLLLPLLRRRRSFGGCADAGCGAALRL